LLLLCCCRCRRCYCRPDAVVSCNICSQEHSHTCPRKYAHMPQEHSRELCGTWPHTAATAAAVAATAAPVAGAAGLMLSSAATYAPKNIRVNCVAPGLTRTPLAERITSNAAALKASESMHALKRCGGTHAVQSCG
jgi:NAD(P)-dependent dehydrogenase (short-subunit alcohol dehydrogenase family)